MSSTDLDDTPRDLAAPPDGAWGRTWLAAAVITIAALLGWESFWRGRGFRPSMVEGGETWAIARARVGPSSIVLLGSSRMQTDVDPRILSSELGGRQVVQLSILGSSPLPLLEELARDGSFRGVAVVGIVPPLVFDGGAIPEKETLAYMTVGSDVARSPARWVEARLRAIVQTRLVLRNRALSPRRIAADLHQGRWPASPRGTTRIDRFRAVDFTRTDTERAVERAWRVLRRARIVRGRRLSKLLDRIERAVEQIQSRGGRVVFVRLPRGGRIARLEDRITPRARYWDVLVRRTRAVAIDTDDDPTTAGFECPDGSHIDVRDSARFTRALAAQLREHL